MAYVLDDANHIRIYRGRRVMSVPLSVIKDYVNGIANPFTANSLNLPSFPLESALTGQEEIFLNKDGALRAYKLDVLKGLVTGSPIVDQITPFLPSFPASDALTMNDILRIRQGASAIRNITLGELAVYTGGGTPVTLTNVVPSTSFIVGVPIVGGTLTGATAGSTFTAAPAGITVTGTGTTRSYSGTPTTAGATVFTEALGGATNTPHDTPVTVAASGLTFVQSANLVMDFNPETLGALADGTAVNTFTDSISGASAIATGGPIVPTSAPTFRNNVLNGKPALRLAGSQWYYLGRPTALVNAFAGDYTVMIVTTNLVAGANALSGLIGNGNSSQLWMVCNLTQLGRNAASQATIPNTMVAGDLYCMFISVRNSGTFPRTLHGVNFTNFAPNSAGPAAGTADFALGTGRTDTSANGNTYSSRCDLMRAVVWNTNLGYVDIVRQVRAFHSYYGKAMPNAGVAKFDLHDGDSITQGVGGKPDACYPYFSAANLGRKLGEWSNNGRTGATLTQLADDFAFQYTGLSGADALNQPVVCSWMEYANMRNQATVYTQTDRYALQLKTLDPTMTSVFMTSTALGGNTTGDQTALGGLGTNPSATGTHRITYSDSYVASHPNMDAVIPLHQDATIGQIGANPYSGTWPTTDFFDVTHPFGVVGQNVANGYARMAALHSAVVGPLL